MLIIKFGEEEWINKLKDGEIFMRPISDYRKLEIEQKKKGQGDKYDGKFHIKQDMQSNMFGIQTKIKELELDFDGDEKNLIGCFYKMYMYTTRLKLISEDDEKKLFLYEFTEEEKKEFAEWGDTALLILQRPFLEKIGEKFKERQIEAYGRNVKYYNCNAPDINYIKDYSEGNENRLFWKDDYFINQNEFRIITAMQADEGRVIFNIGDISDISETRKIKELLNEGIIVPIYKNIN
jgi:hypothetical protein